MGRLAFNLRDLNSFIPYPHFNKMEQEKLEKIRNRKSYAMWRDISEAMAYDTIKDACQMVHNAIDQRHGYGSVTNSQYSEESLNLALQDYGHLAK